ncbi:MAG: flagellin [Kordiimonas sp.]
MFLETFIADLEDVDIAEAVTRLNNDQVALEASYRSIGSLSQLSLLRFL